MPRKMTELEKTLSKGELRKLNALRRSVGEEIGEKAFSEWLSKARQNTSSGVEDKHAERIAQALQPLIEKNTLRIPRQGYLLKRGRRRVVVLPGDQAGAAANPAGRPKPKKTGRRKPGKRISRKR